jgi:uncharacterized protein (TIGR02246 family)
MTVPDSHSAAPDPIEAIKQLTQEWIEAVKARDVDRLLSLVTEDVVFLPPNGSPIKGKQAVGHLYRSLFTQFEVDQTANNEEIEVSGEWAFSWGAEILMLAPHSGGQPVRLHGKGMAILRRQHDGSWKFARGINNAAPEQTDAQ